MLSYTVVIFILCCASLTVLANAKKVVCSNSDEECLTKSTKAIYPIIVAGRPGEVEASDPLHLDEIVLEVQDLKYVLSNATMYGLQQCTVKDVTVNATMVYFHYYIWCPSLTIESDYEVNRVLDGVPVNGKGANKISYSKYHIWMVGYYSRHNDKAGDLHTQITGFTLKIRADEVSREYTGLRFGENEPYKHPPNVGPLALVGAAAAGDNISRLEERIREPLLYNFFQKYVKNLNEFLKIVPIKDIHFELKDN